MRTPGITTRTFRATRLSRTMRLTLLVLLVALTLTSTVSYAQGGDPGPGNDPAALTQEPPSPEPEPPPELPAITLPPAEPGEQIFIAEVTIESAEQLAILQQLGHTCTEGAVCEIEATEAQVSALAQAGFQVDIIGVVVESSHEDGLEESSRYGSNYSNYNIPCEIFSCPGSATSIINISGAPSGATVTRVKYDVRMEVTGPAGACSDYVLTISAFSAHEIMIWNRWGDYWDLGLDDDPETDRDIHLIGRWINSHFDLHPVNQPWALKATDHELNLPGYGGFIDFWKLWVYYDTPSPPAAPTLIAPANTSNTCDTTPAFDWSSVSGATGYQIQVDDSSSFSSPAIDATPSGSSYTPSSALSRKKWYWHARARNAVGWGDWSATWSFTIDGSPATPSGPSPADGATGVGLEADLDWASAAGATSYDVYFGTSSAPPFVANVGGSQHTLPTLSANTRYYWKVVAKNSCGNAGGPVWSFTTEAGSCTRPATPHGPSPADGATGVGLEADLDWASSAGATTYDVYFGTSSTPPFVANVSGSQHTLPTLSANTRYYWKVVAKNSCGTEGGPVWSFTTEGGTCTRPATPAGPSPADGATGVPLSSDLDWADSAGATSYDVYFGTSATPPFAANVSSSQYTPAALAANTRYYWKVLAKNSCGDSGGPVWSFATAGGGTNQPPAVVSVVPSRGWARIGRTRVFRTEYSDPDGHTDLKACEFLVAVSRRRNDVVFVSYDPQADLLYLLSDDGMTWLGGYAPGTVVAVRNSQGILYCNKTTVVKSGNDIVVRWALRFKARYEGRKRLWMRATDMSGVHTPLVRMGGIRIVP